MVGRAVVVTVPWISACWSNALPARPCTFSPTLPPMTLPTALPTAVTPVLSPPASVPSASKVPDSGVVILSAPGCPETASGPRDTEKVSCALDSSFETGFCGLPDRFLGAWASRASRIAVSAIAAGASTVEVPVRGCSGATADSAGRSCCSDLEPGQSRLINKVAPTNAAATTAAPRRTVRSLMGALSYDLGNAR